MDELLLKFRKPSTKKPGLAQGTLVHVGEKFSEKVNFSSIRYNQQNFEKLEVDHIQDVLKYIDDSSVFWLNVVGVHDPKVIQQIGDSFGISNLTLEEIMNTNQHPKIEEFENYIFTLLRTYYYGQTKKMANFENISIILGKNFLITFQEKENDVFASVVDRIQDKNSLLRKKKTDYLFCSIIDTIVDHYFPSLDHLGYKMEKIEAKIVSKSDENLVHKIFQLQQELSIFSKTLRPEREMLNSFLHKDNKFVSADTPRYIHDVYEHVIHLIEILESYRETVTGLHELYLSTISNRMNEVMKMLTVIASLFIPITFVAGLYGMNFQNMPELSSPIAYPLVLIGMTVTSISLFFYFKRRKWV